MRPHRVPAEPDPGADDHGQRQGRCTRADLDGHSAGEVDGPDAVGQPATRVAVAVEVEDPVRDRRVDQHGPHRDEHDPGTEPGPVGDGAGDQGPGDHAEQALEHREQDDRDGQPAVCTLGDQGLQPEVLQRVADESPADVVAEGDRVADEDPDDDDRREGAEGHHHHVQHALGAHHPAVEQREPRCHQEHQGRGCEEPGGVAGVDLGDHLGGEVVREELADRAEMRGESGHGRSRSLDEVTSGRATRFRRVTHPEAMFQTCYETPDSFKDRSDGRLVPVTGADPHHAVDG